MGAAQALVGPFSEVTSIFKWQALRLKIEAFSFTLVFGPLAYGIMAGFSPLSAIWMMAIGGAIGTLIGLGAVLSAAKNLQKYSAVQPNPLGGVPVV